MANKPNIRFKGFTDDWEQRKLGEMSNSYSGGTPKVGTSKYYGGKIPFIRSAEINSDTTELFLTEEGLKCSSARLVDTGDILYALYGATSGEVGRARIKGAINQAILVIKPQAGYDYEFLTQWLRKSKLNIIDRYLQGGQGNLSGTIVNELLVEFPNYEEQTKIGTYFSTLDHLITLHQRKCDETKKLKKFMLQKMFPKNGEKNPEIRFAGFTDDWEQRKLGEWGEFYYGRSCPKWSVTEDAITPCVRYGELYTKFGSKIDEIYSYTNMPVDNLRFSKGNEVLIPRVGEDPMDYNHCTWLSIPGVAIGEMISVFNTTQSPLFSAIMFNATLQREFAMRVEGGSVTNLYYDKLKNIDVLYPTMEEQKEIARYFSTLDHLITLHQRKCDKLKLIKKFMLQNMFPKKG